MQRSLFPSAAAAVTCMKTVSIPQPSPVQAKSSPSSSNFFLQTKFPWFLIALIALPLLCSHLHQVWNQGLMDRCTIAKIHPNSGTSQEVQAEPLCAKLRKTSGRWQVKINLESTADTRRAFPWCTDPRADTFSQPHVTTYTEAANQAICKQESKKEFSQLFSEFFSKI